MSSEIPPIRPITRALSSSGGRDRTWDMNSLPKELLKTREVEQNVVKATGAAGWLRCYLEAVVTVLGKCRVFY